MVIIKPTIKVNWLEEIFIRQGPSCEISGNLYLMKITRFMVILQAIEGSYIVFKVFFSSCGIMDGWGAERRLKQPCLKQQCCV